MFRRFSALAAVAIAVMLAACGGDEPSPRSKSRERADDRRESVVDAVREYQGAFLDKDAEAICNSLTGRGKRVLIATVAPLGGPAGCTASARRIFDVVGEDELRRIEQTRRSIGPDDVRLRRRRATVRLRGTGRRLRLQRVGDQWLISDPGTR
jgi:hypothetical protein